MAKLIRRSGLLLGCGLLAGALPVSKLSAAVTLYDSEGFEPTGNGTDANHNFGDDTFLQGDPTNVAANSPYKWAGKYSGTYTDPTSGQSYPQAVVTTYSEFFGQPNTNASNTQLVVLNSENQTSSTTGLFYPSANVTNPFTPNVNNGTNEVQVFFTMAAIANDGDPFYGVVAYDANNKAIAELGVDAQTGAVVGSSGAAAGTTPGSFYFYELSMNYATQTAKLYAAPTNGSPFVQVGSASFINNTSSFSYAALETFNLNSTTSDGTALFDDYSVDAVPEPMSASMLLGGLAVAGLKRNRRKSR